MAHGVAQEYAELTTIGALPVERAFPTGASTGKQVTHRRFGENRQWADASLSFRSKNIDDCSVPQESPRTAISSGHTRGSAEVDR